MDLSQAGLRYGSTGGGFGGEDGEEEDGGAALPAPILTPEGARQVSALMDGVVHDFMGMVRALNDHEMTILDQLCESLAQNWRLW